MDSFALYRLPFDDSYTEVVQSGGEPERLSAYSQLGGSSGFVVAPFSLSPDCPVVVVRPDRVVRRSVPVASDGRVAAGLLPAGASDRTAYSSDFAKFHSQLQSGAFGKIVLARCAVQAMDGAADLRELFFKACRLYPRMFVALVGTPVTGVWLTATPEVLIENDGDAWHTMALAGTMQLSGDSLAFDNPPGRSPAADAGALDWSPKNRAEQACVATYIKECIESFASEFACSGPFSVRAGNVVHLRSDFRFSLGSGCRLGDVISRLHPTPAVCGLPKQAAMDFINSNEHTPRRYYSGFVGPLGIGGHTGLYVTLRCMNIEGSLCRLYAGGGLLAESVEAAEWQETEAKLATMRRLFEE